MHQPNAIWVWVLRRGELLPCGLTKTVEIWLSDCDERTKQENKTDTINCGQ